MKIQKLCLNNLDTILTPIIEQRDAVNNSFPPELLSRIRILCCGQLVRPYRVLLECLFIMSPGNFSQSYEYGSDRNISVHLISSVAVIPFRQIRT